MSQNMPIEIEGLYETVSFFDSLREKAPALAMKAVDMAGLKIESGAKNYCTVGVAGLLRSSIHYKRDPETVSGEVDVNAFYGPYVEFGTPPHMPPVDALKLWAERILGDENLAWPVAMAIKENGTQAQPFLFPAVEDERPKYAERVKEAFKEIS